MTSARSFAVVGGLGGSGPHSGAFGPHLVSALLDEGARVMIPVRSQPLNKVTKSSSGPSKAKVVLYDPSNPKTFSNALKDARVEVVVSCIGLGGIEAQNDMARWTKDAGVKLFVPSEWSLPTDVDLPEQSYLFPKKQVHETLKALGLPYTLFFNGPFADDLFAKTEWTHIRNGGAMVVGKGEKPISFTTRKDVARYAAHALSTFPWKDLTNTTFRLEAFRSSWLDLLRAYEDYHTTKLSISHISYEKCAEMCERGTPWLNMGRIKWDKEGSDVGTSEEVERTRALWPEWKPETLYNLVKRSTAK